MVLSYPEEVPRMLVRDLMTPKAFTIRMDKKLLVARETMDWARIRHVPVVDASNRLASWD
jgi:CBS-domain-containing membrane protein